MPLQAAPSGHAIQVPPITSQPPFYVFRNSSIPFSPELAQAGAALPFIPSPGSQQAVSKYSELHVGMPPKDIQVPTQGLDRAQAMQHGIPMNMQQAEGTVVSNQPNTTLLATQLVQAVLPHAAAAYNVQPGQIYAGLAQSAIKCFVKPEGQQGPEKWLPISLSEVFIRLHLFLSLCLSCSI